MMRVFTACVRNGRLTLDELTDLPDGALLELVSTEDVLSNGGDLLDAEERAELTRELELSILEADAGEMVDSAEILAELRAKERRPSRE